MKGHIKACRAVWVAHLNTCDRCMNYMTYFNSSLCDIGQVAWDEYCCAILAHPGCERVEGKTCQPSAESSYGQ